MPKSALILGHTTSGMGEKVLALKYKHILEKSGFLSEPIIDIIDFLGENYEPLAQLNYDLADMGYSVMEDLKTTPPLPENDLVLILSWCFSLAALFATGLHKFRFVAANLFVHHSNERIITKLYEPAHLLITGSLLANERALHYGLDPAKLLYLPHCYPNECKNIKPNRHYVERLAHRLNKTVSKNTKVVGCVSRLEYGKNCEFAIEAVRRLTLEKEDVLLVLKGDFPKNSPYPDYQPLLTKMLNFYQDEPWLLWDREHTPFPQVVEEYASFDLLLHPSGAEVASQVVIECLGLKKPVVLLDCSTNPYLFKGVATFVKTTGEIREAQLPFYIPELTDLCLKLKSTLKEPDFSRVEERFDEAVLRERVPLLFEPDAQRIKDLYQQDRKCHGI